MERQFRNSRPKSMRPIDTSELARAFIDGAVSEVQTLARGHSVLLAYSGGLCSSVCAALIEDAIGADRLTCVYVDHGFADGREVLRAADILRRQRGLRLEVLDASDRMLAKVGKANDSNGRRRAFGEEVERIMGERLALAEDGTLLGMGTTYPDIVESCRNVTSHHSSVPSLFCDDSRLIEPIRLLYRDEVRMVGTELGLPSALISIPHADPSDFGL